jgi:hypothetical protein
MRGGLRLPAVVVTIGLLAGCSDPAGAVRRERAAARKASPSPSPTGTSKKQSQHRTTTWWQAPGHQKTANGLRVHTGALLNGTMRLTVTDVGGATSRTITASATPHGATIGHFTLTGVKVAKSPKAGTYGVTFHYRRSSAGGADRTGG